MPFFTAGEQVDNHAILSRALDAGAGVAESATNIALGQLQQGIARISSVAQDEAFKYDKRLEREAIEQAAVDGQVDFDQYQADLLEGDDAYTRAFNETVKSGVAANILRETNTDYAKIAVEHKNDIDGFRGASDALQETLANKYGGDDFGKLALRNAIDQNLTTYTKQITVNSYTTLKQTERANYDIILKSAVNKGLNDIRSGNFDTIEQSLAQAESTIREGVKRGYYKESDVPALLEGTMLEAQEQYARGLAERSAEAGEFDKGRAAIDGWREEQVKNPKNPYSPDQLDAIENAAKQNINQAEAKAKAAAKAQKIQQDKLREAAKLKALVDNASNSGVTLPKTKETQKAVDISFEGIFGFGAARTPEEIEARSQYIGRVGFLPTQSKNYMQAGLTSTNIDFVAAQASLFDIVRANNPKVVAEFDSDVQTYYGSISRQLQAGIPIDQAVGNARDLLFNPNPQVQEVLKSRTRTSDYIKKRIEHAEDFVNSQSGFFESGVDLDDPIRSNRLFEADYSVAYDIAYKKSGGDVEQARAYANSVTASKWGVSTINGDPELMRLPPEVLFGGGGDNEWIGTQWTKERDELSSSLKLKENQKLILTTTNATERSDNPAYTILIQTTSEDGLVTLNGVSDIGGNAVWRPDYKSSDEYLQLVEDKKEAFDKAKQQRIAKDEMTPFTPDEIIEGQEQQDTEATQKTKSDKAAKAAETEKQQRIFLDRARQSQALLGDTQPEEQNDADEREKLIRDFLMGQPNNPFLSN